MVLKGRGKHMLRRMQKAVVLTSRFNIAGSIKIIFMLGLQVKNNVFSFFNVIIKIIIYIFFR